MNQSPDERGEAAAAVDPGSQAAEREGEAPELLTPPAEAPHFNFPFINSDCYRYEQKGGEGRKGEVLEGRRVVYGYNYPTLLVMIILLREWNLFAPKPSHCFISQRGLMN